MAKNDELLLSSPDPLALSMDNVPTPSPIKAKGPKITPRKPLADVSGNTTVQDFYISTPPSRRSSKSPTKPSKHDPSTSPWRIRLTVQAEQVNDENTKNVRISSPKKRLTEHTTTITVPLKGGDDSPPAVANKGRGRPRKSLDSPRKRSGTPKPKPKGRRKTMPERLEENDDPFSISTASPPKKTRERPRKSLESRPDNPPTIFATSSAHSHTTDEFETAVAVGKPVRTRSKGRRKEITPMKFVLESGVDHDQDSSWTSGGVSLAPGSRGVEDGLVRPNTPYLSTQLPLQSSVSNKHSQDVGPATALPGSPFYNESRKVPHEEADSDPTNEHEEYDTILESEGFSMVSVSSLASASNHSSNSVEPDGGLDREHTPIIASSPSVPPAFGDGPVQSSSRQLDEHQDGTPKLARVVRAGIALQGVLSPRNGGPRLSSPFQERDSSGSKNASGQEDESSQTSKSKSPKERLDHLFGGFGAGTRRELRAGLRLGEELAKRQRQVSQQSNPSLEEDEDVFGQEISPRHPQLPLPLSGSQSSYNLVVPKPKGKDTEIVQDHLSSRNQLPTPERSDSEAEEDRMSWKEATPVKTEHLDDSASPSLPIDDEMATEAEWQREREAVSRQIEMANSSQVIVIDSDSDDDDQEEQVWHYKDSKSVYSQDGDQRGASEEDVSDIWRAEAHSADVSRDSTPEAPNVLLQPEAVKPRRSKLPSPWRRSSQVVYSDEVEPSDADLFWQPEVAKKKAKKSNQSNKQTIEVDNQPSQMHADSSVVRQQSHDQIHYQSDDSTGALIASQLNTVNTYDRSSAMFSATLSPAAIPPAVDESFPSFLESDIIDERQTTTPTLPMTPENKYQDEPSETFQEDTSVLSFSDVIVQQTPKQTFEQSFTPIDPLLLQRPNSVPQDINHQRQQKPGPRPPLNLSSQQSWLTYLTAPLTTLFTPLPPPATKSDLLLSSPHEPLSPHHPWQPSHTRALEPLYYASLLYPPHIFPYNPLSPSAAHLGKLVRTPLRWSRRVTKADCAVADAFMCLLGERGVVEREGGERIEKGMVVRMCVAVWEEMGLRGEVAAVEGRGERSGLRREGDRLWGIGDVRWEECATGYFERKRAEFDGLPSWKAMGIKWP